MKRIFSLLFTIILTTSVLTGCSINDFSENYGSYDTSNVVTIARTAAAPAPIATVPKPPVTEKNVETPAKITSNNAVYTTEPAPATDSHKPKKKNIPVIKINNETITAYNTAIDDLKTKKAKSYLYNFNTVMSVGVDSDGRVIDTEAVYGITAYMDDKKIYVKSYDYTDNTLTVRLAALYNLDQIYLNNRWIEMDITGSCEYLVWDADTTARETRKICKSYIPYNLIPSCTCSDNEIIPSDATVNEDLQTGYKVY